ncbi:UNVERIFIED_CONTAM: hypothetical protein Sangu_0390300 [Sesamum angustifolium]|uniref:Uncharacterized protein n=1 Tax=Sesamum angustifolium TaxID=2727405 RepID=A0AAW2QRS8_9LAMI
MDTPRIIRLPRRPPVELSSNFLEDHSQMIVSSAIREQLTVLVPPRVINFLQKVATPELADPALAMKTHLA